MEFGNKRHFLVVEIPIFDDWGPVCLSSVWLGYLSMLVDVVDAVV